MAVARHSQQQPKYQPSHALVRCKTCVQGKNFTEKERWNSINKRPTENDQEVEMRSLLVFVACLAIAPCSSAQQSLFQSGDGQSAIYLRQSSAAFNLGDSKASIGYVHRINTHDISWGFEAYATANSGVSALFSSDKPEAPEGGGDFTFGRHFVFIPKPQPGQKSKGEDWWLVDAGYGRSSFYLFPTGSAPSSNPEKTNFNRFRAVAAYNRFTGGNLLVGIAVGAERRNNISDLTSTSLETIIVPAPAGSQSSIVKTKSGYFGNYKEYIAAPVYTDILFYPTRKCAPTDNCAQDQKEKGVSIFGNRIGVDFFSRSDVAAVNRSSSGGLGIFMFKKDDPLVPIGDISASFNGTKVQVALTVGFTFAK
jgi:hypothetical protein